VLEEAAVEEEVVVEEEVAESAEVGSVSAVDSTLLGIRKVACNPFKKEGGQIDHADHTRSTRSTCSLRFCAVILPDMLR
jgi:hypothetical protein